MMTSNSRATPSPPNLVASLRLGFDAITNHIILIIFPIALDLFLWFGPHLQLKKLIESIVSQLSSISGLQDPGAAEILQAGQEAWMILAERFNIFTALRSYPVGIPSLMVSLLSVETPAGTVRTWELNSPGMVVLAWILITLLGLVAGTLYYDVVSQAALFGQVRWRQALEGWPWASLQVVLLTLFWVVLLVGVSIPGSCIISLVTLVGFSLGQCAVLLYAGLLFWLIFPLLFSPHGIFVKRYNMFVSIKASVRLTRLTLPTTGLFFLMIVLLGKGLDMLWRVPPQTSWLALVGVAGHAFITTSLLASSFVYYRDADQWARNVLQQISSSSNQDAMSVQNNKP